MSTESETVAPLAEQPPATEIVSDTNMENGKAESPMDAETNGSSNVESSNNETPLKRENPDNSESITKSAKKLRSSERFIQESQALLKSLGVDEIDNGSARRTRSRSRGNDTPSKPVVITPAKRSRKSVEKKESKLARESSDDSSNQVGIPKSETDSNKADDSITTELIATKSKDQSENEKEFSIEKVDEQPQLATKTVEDKVEETPATSESTEKSDSQSKSEQKEVEPLVVSSNDDAKSAEEISNENSAVVSEPENEEAASTEKEKVPLIDTVTHVEEAAKSDVQPITDKSEEETNSSEVERVVILNKGDEKSSADEESSAEPKIDESAPEIAQSNGNDAETVSSGEISTQ